jgi:hypothetical protein
MPSEQVLPRKKSRRLNEWQTSRKQRSPLFVIFVLSKNFKSVLVGNSSPLSHTAVAVVDESAKAIEGSLGLDGDEETIASYLASPTDAGYHTYPNSRINAADRRYLSNSTYLPPNPPRGIGRFGAAKIPERNSSITVVSGSVAASDQWEFSASNDKRRTTFGGPFARYVYHLYCDIFTPC